METTGFITKKEMKKKTVAEALKLIYNRQVHESALNELSKDQMKYFIIEIFDKGLLNDYLNLK